MVLETGEKPVRVATPYSALAKDKSVFSFCTEVMESAT